MGAMANARGFAADNRIRVFVSHARADTGFADQIGAFLHNAGFQPLLDRYESGGDGWEHRIGGLIEDADALVLVLTEASANSDMCAWEVEEAQRMNSKERPSMEILRRALADSISKQSGSCCVKTKKAADLLRPLVEHGQVRAVLLTWFDDETGEGKLDVSNHTACLVSWRDGDFVVDTTCGQDGGEDLYVGPPEEWYKQIMALQKDKVYSPRMEILPKPLGETAIALRVAERFAEAFGPSEKERQIIESRNGLSTNGTSRGLLSPQPARGLPRHPPELPPSLTLDANAEEVHEGAAKEKQQKG